MISTGTQRAIEMLNTLQPLKRFVTTSEGSWVNTLKYLKRCGKNLDALESKVIHVSGTKGKGSTCAMVESILRSHGYKTGFFSSPHLISVNERIRINGKPLCYKEFTFYFWNVYNKLESLKESDTDMPFYFNFLTVMALFVFLKKEVDVAIIEVGIGGELDCTNCFSKTPVVGITSLGFDHMRLLGHTIEEIAWQKAGIMKTGCFAFTSYGQNPAALKVLENRAEEKQCALRVAPLLTSFEENCSGINPNTVILPQLLNLSLALMLACTWMKIQGKIPLPKKLAEGLKKVSWPGRFQVLHKGSITFYLDGAHTPESIEICRQWFISNSSKSVQDKVLIFNVTGYRDSKKLLMPLLPIGFKKVIFCPNNVSTNPDKCPPDMMKFYNGVVESATSLSEERLRELGGKVEVELHDSVEEALLSLEDQSCSPVDVLITGSLHLIGSALFVLDPNLSSGAGLNQLGKYFPLDEMIENELQNQNGMNFKHFFV